MLDFPKGGDLDPVETQEWLDALQAVVAYEGHDRAKFLLGKLGEKARETGVHLPFNANTPYLNTIPPSEEERKPGQEAIEWRIRTIIRWNAMAMVVRANKVTSELGGHIASFASSATSASRFASFSPSASIAFALTSSPSSARSSAAGHEYGN